MERSGLPVLGCPCRIPALGDAGGRMGVGREIFFRRDGVMAAPVTRVGDGIEIGPPTRLGLSDAPVSGPLGSDGKRFLVVQRDPAAGSVPTQVVRNWSALLARQAR